MPSTTPYRIARLRREGCLYSTLLRRNRNVQASISQLSTCNDSTCQDGANLQFVDAPWSFGRSRHTQARGIYRPSAAYSMLRDNIPANRGQAMSGRPIRSTVFRYFLHNFQLRWPRAETHAEAPVEGASMFLMHPNTDLCGTYIMIGKIAIKNVWWAMVSWLHLRAPAGRKTKKRSSSSASEKASNMSIYVQQHRSRTNRWTRWPCGSAGTNIGNLTIRSRWIDTLSHPGIRHSVPHNRNSFPFSANRIVNQRTGRASEFLDQASGAGSAAC